VPTIADGTKSSALLRSVSSLGQGKELWEALMWSSWLEDNDLLCKDYSGFILLIRFSYLISLRKSLNMRKSTVVLFHE